MPNHFHAIIIIGENKYNTNRQCGTDHVLNHGDHDVDCGDIDGDATHHFGDAMDDRTDAINRRDATHRVNTTTPTTEYQNTFAPQSKNLASIIRGFKSSVTINAQKINANFGWQSRFHDHIIRNEESFQRISDYIINNPSKWQDDKFFTS